MATSTKLGLIVRAMSSAASGTVKPPVQIFGLEGRYATALYSAATKLKQLDSVEKELVQVQNAIKKNQRLKDVLCSPIVSRAALNSSIKDFASKANVSSATTNLLVLLADNGRLKKIDGVINAFKTIMAAHRGEVVCEVTSARPLEDSQRKQLEDVLKKFVKSNQTILLQTKVDPALLGGLIVSVGDKYVDMSVASKVKRYTSLINSTA